MKKTSENKKVPWWVWIAGIDLLMLLVTWLEGYQIEIPYAWRLHGLRLTHEMNLAAWWSGACFIALAMLSHDASFGVERRLGRALRALALFFAFLSLSEIGSVHERLSALQYYSGMALAVALLVLIPLWTAWFALRGPRTRRTGWLLVGAVALIASVGAQEMLEHAVDWAALPWGLGGMRGALEEGTELLATLLFFAALVELRRERRGKGFGALVADLHGPRQVLPWVLGGLALHLVACLLVFPALDDIPRRGNPAVWYPVALNLLLACHAYRAGDGGPEGRRAVWRLAAAGFVFSSASLMGNLLILLPGVTLLVALPERILFLYGWQAVFTLSVLREHGLSTPWLAVGFGGMVVPALLQLIFVGETGLMLLFYGLFVCGAALAMVSVRGARAGADRS